VFQLLKNPNFDFMGRRHLFLGLSSILVVVSIGIISVKGLEKGIEFSGGTELQTRFASSVAVEDIRDVVSGMGIDNPIVTTSGDVKDNEVFIRLGVQAGVDGEKPGQLATRVRDELRAKLFNLSDDGATDLNLMSQAQTARLLRDAPGVSDPEALAEGISALKRENAIFHSIEDLSTVPGMTPEALGFLRTNTTTGPLAVRKQGYVGPAVGKELMSKARLAIIGSLIGMLLYIWIRFQLQWGLAAVVALAHDTIITLGLFSLFGQELSLAVVAAFLTLVGYSVNDTVVVFDRIRENLKSRRGDTLATVNKSINQTLARTVITSGLTWIAVLVIYLYGGEGLRPLAFVLTVGVAVGTYSSIWVAAPFLMLWRTKVEAWQRGASGQADAQ